MAMNRGVDWPNVLMDQLDFAWARQARPRLDGLSDQEYFWEPVPDSWNIRPGPGTCGGLESDLIMDSDRDAESAPDPVTTIAWRMAHIIVHILKARTYSIFDDSDSNPDVHVFAGTAAGALDQLDAAYLRWKAGCTSLADHRLAEPIVPAERYFEGKPMATLILHVNREVLSHIAEIALLRDLYLRQESI